MSPRERFATLARRPDARIDLAEAALWIAAEACPGLTPGPWLERLRRLAEAAAPRLAGVASPREQALRLAGFLFAEQGFRGNAAEYDDPRNSYLHEVLERRTGIPITLALVLLEVGRRNGVAIEGIGFPGHFLVKVLGEDEEIVLDPFRGLLLSEQECAERLATALGSDARWERAWLRAATPREILVRMLQNLKRAHAARGELEAAIGCCDRVLLLLPDAPSELRDRAILWRELECFAPALADLERFAKLAPREAASREMRELLQELRQAAGRLH